ncbi:MAG: Lrp/AsnC family transcriptional regulator [Lachnospiraceae bacterium]
MHDLDEIDVQILNILQRDGRKTVKEIASTVNLSSPAVSTRIDKLEKEQYILGYQAIVNPQAVDLQIKAFISLEVDPKQKHIFYPYIEKCVNVVQCNCVTGEYSMLLEVYFKTTVELDHFIGVLQRFGRTKTLIVFSTSVEHRGVMLKHSED